MVPQFGGIGIEASTNWRIATTVWCGRFSVVSYQLSVNRLHLLHQGRQHSLDLNCLCCEALVLRIPQIVEVVSKQKLVLEFASGPHRNLYEASRLGTTLSATALCNIHSY